LLDRGNVKIVLPLVEYSLSKKGKNELNDEKIEVDMDVEVEERKYASKLETFQRSLMETRFKIEQLLRERLARKKGEFLRWSIHDILMHNYKIMTTWSFCKALSSTKNF